MTTFQLSLDSTPLGSREGECAHCRSVAPLVRHRLLGRVNGLPVPCGEALACPRCAKLSRDEGPLSRLVSALFLIPLALVLAAGVAAGLYFLFAMLVGSAPPSGAYLVLAAVLVGVAGWAEYRAVMTLCRLASRRRLLPLENLLARI